MTDKELAEAAIAERDEVIARMLHLAHGWKKQGGVFAKMAEIVESLMAFPTAGQSVLSIITNDRDRLAQDLADVRGERDRIEQTLKELTGKSEYAAGYGAGVMSCQVEIDDLHDRIKELGTPTR